MSAPPEVAFNTATDPDRLSGWLPAPLCADHNHAEISDSMRGRWRADAWSAVVTVRPADPGGAVVALDLDGDLPEPRLAQLAHDSLDQLAEYVADNLTAG